MGSIDGFMKIGRDLPKTRDPKERVKDYKEFYVPHSEELTKKQASRCMDCGVPFCHKGCPLGNIIPDFNDAVHNDDWNRATDLLLETNNFPEFTGRICPAPCEGACVLGINKPPVAIEHIEKSIIEKAFESGKIQPNPPIKRKLSSVAVIGSGPAGLAAADQLNKAGYQVTVFERDEKIGGLLRFGIPDFKLEKWVVERRVNLLIAEGITFKTNIEVGVDLSISDLKNQFTAVLLATGATIPRDIDISGRNLKGIHFAMDFLTQQNKRVSELDFDKEDLFATDKNVIVIGGGDTGSDCIGTSNRQGAKSVTQFELLDKPGVSRGIHNPWPEWPLVLRTSSSHEEGVDRTWSVLTKSFIGDENGNISGLKTVKVVWENGKFNEIPETEKIYPCDLVLIAVGFVHTQKEGLLDQLNINLDERGNVKAQNYKTNVDKVFTAGDMRRGQSLVVWAIQEGREAARALDQSLSGKSSLASKERSSYEL
ncbi:glutamate synthase subunit beta [Cyclobacteriaceae bacterium]|jgi:glutamate synthase (NADPH/NADH) small chain|nr:glutamate synthase subunit beta [Cyclobacteriaceae bacterium]MDB4291605.1 glutamate synthase subunit beta [Cyclobacteriaceae bacterium]MDB4315878.1 glutamate synthase subunit beta [Cyclobacteriaceae bacterium]MDB9939292.1 glutamate synthase subunit beta [Cyclobacteriaceae bacterium]|tara:strand:- start:1172 stop:2617 length:1446 start_codon:yes stop_codon:yes gene_type:complete